MSNYKVSFKGNLILEWSLKYKPSRQDIKDSLIKAILNLSPEELAEHMKIASVEEIVE